MPTVGRFVAQCLTVAIIGTVSAIAASAQVTHPVHLASGASTPELENDYLAAQSSPSLSDAEKVRAAVDVYFTLKYESRARETALNLAIVVDTTSRSGRTLHDYELGRLHYSIACYQATGTLVSEYFYRPEYQSLDIQNHTATVRIRPWVDLIYADDRGRPAEGGGEPHTVTLTRGKSGWRIIGDQYRDEFTMMFPRDTDFTTLERGLPSQLRELHAEWAEIELRLASDPRSAYRFTGPADEIDLLGYRSYDRNKCSYYGMTYTNNNQDCSTTDYNPLFVEYASSLCADCQNFVSQCVWYGFGGQNISTAIQNRYLPMVANWWATGSNAHANWINVSSFRNMAAHNFDNDLAGVQGSEGPLSTVRVGDIAALSTWGHVYIIVNIVDHNHSGSVDYNEIYVSAHTSNRQNARLSNYVANPASVKYVLIHSFKEP